MQLIPAQWVIAAACVFTFYLMADYEAQRARAKPSNRLWWPLLSFLVSVISIRALDSGAFAVLVGQIGLFLGIGVWRTVRD